MYESAELIREIEDDYRRTGSYTGKYELDPNVRQALMKVPRDVFIPVGEKPYAYANVPLPIGHGQTISQPYIVALMTDLLVLQRNMTVLEIGTGSGYQAAILAQLAKQVYTIELIQALAEQARTHFRQLGITNIATRIGDGHGGWPEAAPFDAIMLTAACDVMPTELLAQLANNGRMVIPIGAAYGSQELVLIKKDHKGKISQRNVLPVRFVPFVTEAKKI